MSPKCGKRQKVDRRRRRRRRQVDSPEENWQSGHKGLKIVVTIVLCVRLKSHIPENLLSQQWKIAANFGR